MDESKYRHAFRAAGEKPDANMLSKNKGASYATALSATECPT
jgi:hypothetical protein